MPTPFKSAAINILTTVSVTVVMLVFVEIFLILAYPVWYRPPRHLLEDDPKWSALIYRQSTVPGLSYELVPNRDQPSHGTRVQTNSLGMRDTEPAESTIRPIRRIAAIGDSYTFGFGVEGDKTWPSVLERQLNSDSGGNTFDVMNMGVGGYSTRDEALVFEHKTIALKPERAILAYYLNDPEIAPIQTLHAYFHKTEWWQYFNLFRLIAKGNNILDKNRLGGGDYFKYLHNPDEEKWQSVVTAFGDIARVSRKTNIPVVVAIFPNFTRDTDWSNYPYRDVHEQIRKAANDNGLPVIDLVEQYSAFPPEQIMVKPRDSHPSNKGHEIAATAVYDWLKANSGVTLATQR